VDCIFPPLNPKKLEVDGDWNEWKYWQTNRVQGLDLETLEAQLKNKDRDGSKK
jgi:hypothetical protein